MKSLLLSLITALAFLPTIAQAEQIFGLTTNDRLIRFDSATPGSVTSVSITGLPPNEFLLAIDFRPVATDSPSAASNGVLYGLGATHHLYTLNTTTGAATVVPGAPFGMGGIAFGTDFNPVVDRLRVVNDVEENFRLDPNTASVAGFDVPLAFTAGDPNVGVNPNVVGAAYTNNFGGATQTTLYGIDFAVDALVRQGGVNGVPSPNSGELTTIGPLGFDTTSEVGFDISGQTGIAYASLTPVVSPLDVSSRLFTIDLATGQATQLGFIGAAVGVGAFITRDIAAPVGTPVPEPGTLGLLFVSLAVVRCRSKVSLHWVAKCHCRLVR
jgi:uncharacterized protein DUF4394